MFDDNIIMGENDDNFGEGDRVGSDGFTENIDDEDGPGINTGEEEDE